MSASIARTSVRWSSIDDSDLLRMRNVDRLSWDAIAAAMPGRSAAACEQRYYGKLKGARGRPRRQSGPPPVKPPVRKRKPRPVFGPPPEPPQRPEGVKPLRVDVRDIRRGPDLAALREHAELRLRIAERGLTGGVLGDPPPGRSALDQRTRAAAAGPELPYKRGGLDGY